METIYDFKIKAADGKETTLESYRGKALLIVNVASKCGYTPQYDGLEKLHQEFEKMGLEILGFPCNQFGGQEPGSESEIQSFCRMNYGVSFPVFAKIEVNGPEAHPLYGFLKKQKKGILGTEAIKWNFTKFLIDRDGNVIQRYAPATEPQDLREDIKTLLS